MMGTITKASYERLAAECAEWHKRCRKLEAALTDLRMAVGDLMREHDFEVSETLSCALDIADDALALDPRG